MISRHLTTWYSSHWDLSPSRNQWGCTWEKNLAKLEGSLWKPSLVIAFALCLTKLFTNYNFFPIFFFKTAILTWRPPLCQCTCESQDSRPKRQPWERRRARRAPELISWPRINIKKNKYKKKDKYKQRVSIKRSLHRLPERLLAAVVDCGHGMADLAHSNAAFLWHQDCCYFDQLKTNAKFILLGS